jgi:hypothetical protein
MKKFMFIAIAMLSLVVFTGCGPTTYLTKAPTMVEATPEGSMDQLYVQANLWMIDQFNSAESVIQFSDKDAGIFKGKYLIYSVGATTYTRSQSIYATLTIRVSDNRVQMDIVVIDDYPTWLKKTVDSSVADLVVKFKSEFQ